MSNHNNSIDESQQAEQAKLSEQPQPSEQQAQSAEQPQLSGQMGVIYKITCLVNGKGYVGKTKQKLEKRMTQHRYESKKGSIGLGAAIEKYKWENFTVEILEECPVELLSDREIFFIRELDTKAPNGYNLTDGGEGLVNPSAETRAKMSVNHPDISGEKNPNYGKKTPPEVCAKISAGNKGKHSERKGQKTPPEVCAKISAHHADVSGEKNPNYGKKTPPEVCAKISAANKGKPSPQKGRKRSPETCAKISAACMGRPSPRKGKKHTPESIAKMSAAKKGKKGTPHTPESKSKIAAALKAAWARRKKAVENGGK